MEASISRLLKAPLTWLVILALLGVELVLAVGFYVVERARLHAIEKEVTYGTKTSPKHFWLFEMPGIRNPPILPAAQSKIADVDEVIGVVANGKPRAYWLKALEIPTLAHRQRCRRRSTRFGDLLRSHQLHSRLYEWPVIHAARYQPRRIVRQGDGRKNWRRALLSRKRTTVRPWSGLFTTPIRRPSVGTNNLERVEEPAS